MLCMGIWWGCGHTMAAELGKFVGVGDIVVFLRAAQVTVEV